MMNSAEGSVEKEPYRVMVVDDSLVIRGIINRMIQSDPMIRVIKSVGNGLLAVSEIKKDKLIEVVILDIEMPIMDGLTALPTILESNPNVQVIMSSTLTLQNAEISMRALSLGACDYITKPNSASTLGGDTTYQKELIDKIKTFGKRARGRILKAGGVISSQTSPLSKEECLSSGTSLRTNAQVKTEEKSTKADAPKVSISKKSLYDTNFTLLKPNFKVVPEIIAIGSSTGGPPALFKMFEEIKTSIKQPIVITQHMPATFTKILAEHIERISGKKTFEATDGMMVEAGKVYVAPGGYHMVLSKEKDNVFVRINSDPPENFCRPSVDPMFRSVAKIYGPKALGLVLTGMGYDGAKGAKVIVEAGGNVIAQDEATSVVWGMPGATAQLGVCCAVLPLNEISSYIKGVV